MTRVHPTDDISGGIDLSANQNPTGLWTFSQIPLFPGVDPTQDNQAVRRAFVTELPDVIVEAFAKNFPDMGLFRTLQWYDAEALQAAGSLVATGSGSATYDAVSRQVELSTGLTAGSLAQFSMPLRIAGSISGGYGSSFNFGAAGTTIFAIECVAGTSGGVSGSGRPVVRIGITENPNNSIAALADRGFEFRITHEFQLNSSTEFHDGSTRTEETHSLGISNRTVWIIFKHTKVAGGDRLMDVSLSQANEGGGRIVVGTQQVNKHYQDLSDPINLNVVVGNNTKTQDTLCFVKQAVIAATHQ